MKLPKKLILHHIISSLKAGKKLSQISQELKLKKQSLQYYLRYLKENDYIFKKGYGVWVVTKEVSISSKAYQKEVSISHKQIRGHAFNWKVKLDRSYDWKKKLQENRIPYNLIGINQSTPRIIFQDKKIWFTKTGMVIYEPKSYFSRSSFTSKGMAVWELDKIIKLLLNRLKIPNKHYLFTTSREHYGMIKNELARQYNNKGEKLFIRDDKGIWMWIDNSHSLHELETGEPIDSRNVQKWYNDMKKTKFEVTPSFLMESLNKITDNFQLAQNEIFKIKEENTLIKHKLSLNPEGSNNIPKYIL